MSTGQDADDPSELVDRYRVAGARRPGTIAQHWQVVADARPDHPAIAAPDGVLTYRELSRRSDRVASGLLDHGLIPGERVLLQLTNRVDAVVAWYGLLKAGLVPVCTLPAHRHHEIGEIGRRSRASAHLVDAGVPKFDMLAFAQEIADLVPSLRCILTVGAPTEAAGVSIERLASSGDDTARARVAETQHSIGEDSIAVVQLSGGTTGTPKLIPRRHHEYWYNALAYGRALGWDDTVCTAHILPIFHNAGVIMGLLGPHAVGGTAVIAPPAPDRFLPLLAAHRVTDILMGAVMADLTAPVINAAPALRRVMLSGSKPPPTMVAEFESAGVWAGQTYGMAEGMFCTTPAGSSRDVRLNSVGAPLSSADEIRILEPETDRPVPDGEVGEVCVRGPYTIGGYLDSAEHNRRAFTADGFYRTGDLGMVRVEAGYRCYSIEGRIKDVIDRGGEKVSVDEVEALILDHPAVAAVAVVAMPDVRLGEKGCAYIVPVPGCAPDLADVTSFLRARGVAVFKWPERVNLVGQLPKTAVGKIDKKALRADIATKLTTVEPLQQVERIITGVEFSSYPLKKERGAG